MNKLSTRELPLGWRVGVVAVLFGVALVSLAGSVNVGASSKPDGRRPTFQDAIGSWFGRAIPVLSTVPCPPGSPGCPVPPEIVMIFTVNADGTFIGIDSNIFAGGTHSTAHGEWLPSGQRSIKAEFTLLQSAPGGLFIGGFKNLFSATVASRDEMTGAIDAYLYAYTDPSTGGRTIVDADGFPTPSPLEPASECGSTPGCQHLGQFSFKVRRVSVH
ncbi:MAG: hypothetical protein WCP29_01785 [Acidobacteriota bacterium]